MDWTLCSLTGTGGGWSFYMPSCLGFLVVHVCPSRVHHDTQSSMYKARKRRAQESRAVQIRGRLETLSCLACIVCMYVRSCYIIR